VSVDICIRLSASLHNRRQGVVVENCLSSVGDVVNEVPKALFWGLFCFNIICDIDNICCGDNNLQLVADDCKHYSSVTFNCNLYHSSNLQIFLI
jgi:hypothetical protein